MFFSLFSIVAKKNSVNLVLVEYDLLAWTAKIEAFENAAFSDFCLAATFFSRKVDGEGKYFSVLSKALNLTLTIDNLFLDLPELSIGNMVFYEKNRAKKSPTKI